MKQIEIPNIELEINDVKIMNGKDDSYVLYLSVTDDTDLRNLLSIIFEKLPTEKYNPNTFKFHITLDIDKDYEKINMLHNKIKEKFNTFNISINKLGLFEIYPAVKVYEK